MAITKKGLSCFGNKIVFMSYRLLIYPCTIGCLLVYEVNALHIFGTLFL